MRISFWPRLDWPSHLLLAPAAARGRMRLLRREAKTNVQTKKNLHLNRHRNPSLSRHRRHLEALPHPKLLSPHQQNSPLPPNPILPLLQPTMSPYLQRPQKHPMLLRQPEGGHQPLTLIPPLRPLQMTPPKPGETASSEQAPELVQMLASRLRRNSVGRAVGFSQPWLSVVSSSCSVI